MPLKEFLALTFVLALTTGAAAASSFDETLERYLDLRESNASVPEKLGALTLLKPAVEALVKAPPAYPHPANIEFLSLSLLFTELEYISQISSKPMYAPEFESLRRRHLEGLERNCKESGHLTSCTNFFYSKLEGSQIKLLPENELNNVAAAAALNYARGRRTPHFLRTLAWALDEGIGMEMDKKRAFEVDALAHNRAPFQLVGRGSNFSNRSDVRSHLLPWLAYTSVRSMEEQVHSLLNTVNTENGELLEKVKALNADTATRPMMVEFYKETLIATINMTQPRGRSATRKGWPTSEIDFAWRSVLERALDTEAKAVAQRAADEEILMLAKIEGVPESEINSTRGDLKSRFYWSPEDGEFERIMAQ